MQNKVITPITLHVDASNYNRPSSVYAKQCDANTRFLKIRIVGHNGEISVSGTAQLNATKPDGTRSFTKGEINDDGTITVELTSQLLAVDGKVSCDVTIFDAPEDEGGKEILTTSTFFILVDKSNYNSDAIESMDEFSTVSDALTKIGKAEDYARAAEAAQEAAETAQSGAGAAQGLAEVAQAAAEKAQSEAGKAKGEAEAAQAAAESAAGDADSAKLEAIKQAGIATEQATQVLKKVEEIKAGEVLTVEVKDGVATLRHNDAIYDTVTAYDLAIEKGFAGTEDEWYEQVLDTRNASQNASIATEAKEAAEKARDDAENAADNAENAALEVMKEKITQTAGDSEELIMSQKSVVDYVSTASAKIAYTKETCAEIEQIIPYKYVTAAGELRESSIAFATDFISLDFDTGSTITARCSIHGAWSLVIYDNDYKVLFYINGNNASKYNITPNQDMQDVSIELPVGAAFIRLTGSNSEEFFVRGNKSINTEDIVLHTDEKISKIYNTLSEVFATNVKIAIIGCLSKMAWIISNGANYLNNLVKALGFDQWTDIVPGTGIYTETGVVVNSTKMLTTGYIDVTDGKSIESTIGSKPVYYVVCCYDADKKYLGKALMPDTKIGDNLGPVYGTQRLSLSKTSKSSGAIDTIYEEQKTAYIRIVFLSTDLTSPYINELLNITLFYSDEDGAEKQKNLDCALIESEAFLE